ncbi:MAG: hypothetical protein MUF34_02295 [Polyangiaceae bacterium]|nr:hypothetical protein [Polyangiaceae bacterium]
MSEPGRSPLSLPLPVARRAGLLAVVYLATALPAVLAGAFVARSAALLVAHDPRGDALFWQPGGAWLAEAARGALDLAPAALPLAPWLLAPWALALVVPWGLLLIGLMTGGSLRRGPLGLALLDRLGPLVSLTALSVLTRAAVVALGLGLAAELGPLLAGPDATARTRDLLTLALGLSAPLGYGMVRWVHDLALAACVRRRESAASALVSALGTAYHNARRSFGPWLASTLAQGALVAASAWGTGRLTGARYEWPAIAVLHQLTLLGLVVARAWWLRRALVLVGPPWPPPDDD